jgi:2,5-furandicarboxylate decarboxylase 1
LAKHLWEFQRSAESRGEALPVAFAIGVHPAIALGCLAIGSIDEDERAIMGGLLGEPLELIKCETSEVLVPAHAEMIIEAEILPHERTEEGPFGEFTGYSLGARQREVVKVRAITHRRDAIFQHTFVGHRDVWVLGGIPKEGSLFNLIRGVVPTTKAVHFPISGCCRFHCYISIDKKVDGETKQAALAALGGCDFVKHVVVTDTDIDIYDEEEVLWAVATRVQADQDVDVIKNVKGNTLDPSQTDDIMTAKMIIDATKPLQRPFAARVAVPQRALDETRLEDFIPRAVLEKVPKS